MAKILVVDDAQDMTQMMQIMLEKGGHTVQTAQSSKQAKDLIDQNDYELVIVDIFMPEEKGTELIEQLQKRKDQYKTNIKIIMMTGAEFTDIPGDAFKIANDSEIKTMCKPFTQEDLNQTVQSALTK